MNIYGIGFMGEVVCTISESIEDAYLELKTSSMMHYLDIYDFEEFKNRVKIIKINNNKFNTYDIWEYTNE